MRSDVQPMLRRIVEDLIRQQTHIHRLDDPRRRRLQIVEENIRHNVHAVERVEFFVAFAAHIAHHLVLEIGECAVAGNILALEEIHDALRDRQLWPQECEPMHGAPS